MGRYRAKPVTTQSDLEVVVEILSEGQQQPSEVIRVPAPEGFPPERLHELADYWARGFNEACERLRGDIVAEEPETITCVDLSKFAASLRGRPSDPKLARIGREATKLHQQNPKLSWRRIALKVCPRKAQAGHHCSKKCADRIRQAAEQYEYQQDLEKLSRGE